MEGLPFRGDGETGLGCSVEYHGGVGTCARVETRGCQYSVGLLGMEWVGAGKETNRIVHRSRRASASRPWPFL